jgi:cobalt-zinc-cadmium efflux system protein
MSYGHSHSPANFDRAFIIGILLNSGFVATEAVFGFLSHSLALLADAGHNLGDVLGLVMAWTASYLVKRAPTRRHTYGFRASSILAALANAIILLVITGALSWEAIRRLIHPEPVVGTTMIWVAAVGVVINSVTALMFMAGRKRDLNLEGAFMHMAADAAVTFGVVVAGIAIYFTQWLWLDPLISLLIGVVIAVGTWGLLRESLNLSLAAVPTGIDSAAVENYLSKLPGVAKVHDLHIWAMSTTEIALTAHLVKPDGKIDDPLLVQIQHQLHDRFGIGHMTIQLECGGPDSLCAQESAHVV